MDEILKAIRDEMKKYTSWNVELNQLKGSPCLAIHESASSPIYDLGKNYWANIPVSCNARSKKATLCMRELDKVKQICHKRFDLTPQTQYKIINIDILTDINYTGREEKGDYLYSLIFNVKITRKEQ